MPRLTVTISDDHEQMLEEKADTGEAFRSKSEVVRECIEAYERVEELSNQMACLEAEVNMLREQREQLKRKATRVEELEAKLRQLQMEYHTLISEGKSPTELEPKIDTTLELETETPVTDEGEETIEATAPTTTRDRDDDDRQRRTESSPPATGSASNTETAEREVRTVEATSQSGASQAASPSASATAPSASATAPSASATAQTNGGVEIDEELLYQSPGVGSRLKSALFGGPGGSR